MRRLLKVFAFALPLLLVLFAAGGCASASKSVSVLEQAQYDWSAAIRWGDFDGALNLVDPVVREHHTPSAMEMERYKQVQVSSYRDLGSASDVKAGTAQRDIEIGVINRHTQTERTVRYRETWRFDVASKRWWLTSGLPDLWAGQ